MTKCTLSYSMNKQSFGTKKTCIQPPIIDIKKTFSSSFLADPDVLFNLLSLQIEPSVAVTTSLAGYVSVFALRGGVYGDGTLVRGGLPVKLSYQADRYPGRKWCLDLSARVTALELEAGIFYQWISCRWKMFWLSCRWGDRHTLYRFGKWAAFRYNWRLFQTCF